MSFMTASELHVSIQSKTLARIIDKYKDVIEEVKGVQGVSEGLVDIPLFVTVNKNQVTLETYGLDCELPCPAGLDELMFSLIELFGDEDIMDDIQSQIMDEDIDPSNLDVDDYGLIGELYKDLCKNEESILKDIQLVNWKVGSEENDGEDTDSETSWCVFTYDPVSGENYEE